MLSLLPPKSKGGTFLHFGESYFALAPVFVGLCELAQFPGRDELISRKSDVIQSQCKGGALE